MHFPFWLQDSWLDVTYTWYNVDLCKWLSPIDMNKEHSLYILVYIKSED